MTKAKSTKENKIPSLSQPRLEPRQLSTDETQLTSWTTWLYECSSHVQASFDIISSRYFVFFGRFFLCVDARANFLLRPQTKTNFVLCTIPSNRLFIRIVLLSCVNENHANISNDKSQMIWIPKVNLPLLFDPNPHISPQKCEEKKFCSKLCSLFISSLIWPSWVAQPPHPRLE